MSKYTTGEIAKLCSVSVRTVQYYDTRGILVPSELSEGGRRLYNDSDLNQMRVICFLRETGMSINSISELLSEQDSEKVINILLDNQQKALETEIAELQEKLSLVYGIKRELKNTGDFSVEALGDIANILENKKKLKKLHATMLITGLPLSVIQWASIILWIVMGIWWPFVVYMLVAVPYAIWISVYYYKRVAYICPECHEIFKPSFKEMFFAAHTPATRKLTCKKCGHKGFCVETYSE